MISHRSASALGPLLVAACLTLQAGCTSALSTAYLRDALWDITEHAAEEAPETAAAGGGLEPAAADTSARVAADAAADRADTERREAAIEEAMDRLAKIGTLDAATRATLVDTLQATQQEDWPVVIEAFSATLSEMQPRPPAVVQEPPPASLDAAESPAAAPAAPLVEAAAPSVEPPPASAPPPPDEPDLAVAAPPAPQPPADPPRLDVRNACFASRVRGWSAVDRFAADRFRPGQDVIVYFELDGLSAKESSAGWTTCIDTTLRLVAEDDRELHAWRFEPITETCPARRHDYFARYVVRLPEGISGPCRVEAAVTDTLAGTTAAATLPCTVE
jgi:hypothetical protein